MGLADLRHFCGTYVRLAWAGDIPAAATAMGVELPELEMFLRRGVASPVFLERIEGQRDFFERAINAEC